MPTSILAKPRKSERMLMSEQDAADELQICPRTLWGLAKTGMIPVVRIGRRKLFDRRDVLSLIDRMKVQH